jgi:hypothetical protein
VCGLLVFYEEYLAFQSLKMYFENFTWLRGLELEAFCACLASGLKRFYKELYFFLKQNFMREFIQKL